jgi:hypothetical protein
MYFGVLDETLKLGLIFLKVKNNNNKLIKINFLK